MKKSLSFITALMLVLAFIFTLNVNNLKVNAASSDEEILVEELNNITVPKTAIIDFPVVSVSANGATIEWVSNNPSVLNVPSNGGWVEVNRPTDNDATVTLTVTLTLNGVSKSNNFEVNVPKGVTVTNKYTITYVLNGGTNHANNPTEYYVGQTPVLNAPTKGTVAFLGWYLNDSFTGEKVTSLPYGTSGNVTLYAKWAPASLTNIRIDTYPTKLVYNALETFNANGIKVTAVYNDGHEEDVTSLVEYDKQQLHGDDTQVTVSYQGLSQTIGVTVNKLNYDLSGITFESAEKQYNGAPQTLSYTGTLPQGLTATVVGSATNVSEGAVTVKLVFANSNERDYNTPQALERTLTITKAPLTITAESKEMRVGTSLPELTIKYEGFKGSDTEAVLSELPTVSTNATSTSPAGQYVITLTKVATASNYAITFVDGTLSINDGTFTIVATSNTTVTYNGSTQSFTAVVKDGENTLENVELTYTLNGNPFTGAINAGTYSVLVSYNDNTYGTGSTTITFVIGAKELEASMFASLPEVSYTGTEHRPSVNGTYNNKALAEGTDYTLSYNNNIEKGTAHVIVTAVENGNYSGEVTLEFVIGLSDLERVTVVKNELESSATLEDGQVVPTTHENGSSIFWASTSTAVSVNENGAITTVKTDVEQTVVVYAIITKGNAAEYATFTVVVPAKQNETPVVGKEEVTSGNVTVSNIPTSSNVQSVKVETVTNNDYLVAYDITLLDESGAAVSLNNASVKVKLVGTYEVGKSYEIYYLNGDDATLVATVEAEDATYIEFEATHFSVYAVKEKVEQGGEPSESTTATVVIADYAAANGWVNSTKYESLNIDTNITVTVTGGSNTGKYYDNGNNWRIYQNENPTVTITANGTIVSVKVTYTINNTGVLVLNGTNIESDEVVPVNASSITFTVGNTGDATNGQVRITAIEVVYTSGSGSVTPEPSHELVACETCGKCTVENCDVESHEKCEGHEVTPEPSHELVACETCGKCTVENCDVEDHEKCEGHEVVDTNVSIAEAVEIANTYEHNTYSEIKYTVTGVVSELYNTTYGNFHLVDENGNDLTIYGLYQNSIRYDAMTVKPVEGDTVTITGVLGKYNTTPQMKNAELVSFVAPDRTVSVSVNDELMGSATLNKETVENGGTVTLTITVNEGYEISAIKVNDISQPTTTREFTITANTTIVVEFKEISQGGDVTENTSVTFEFGANGEAAHVDGNALSASKSYTEGNYTLSLTGATKVYDGARDAKGNSCLKLGTSSVVGTFTFTVPEDVTEVVIKVAKYKSNTTKVEVNGTAYTINSASNDGAYDEIKIDTSATKTVTFTTVSGGVRCMIDSITYVIKSSN